jgi:hypothetical protein
MTALADPAHYRPRKRRGSVRMEAGTGRWRRLAFVLLLCVAVAGCEDEQQRPAGVASQQSERVDAAQAAGERSLAVSHSFQIRLPSDRVEALQRRHLDDCRARGCLVLSTRLDRHDEAWVTALSSVRIPPEAFPAFAAVIAAPPGEVVAHTQSAEDQTLPLLDVETRLAAKRALRDRLASLLRDPATASVADLLAVETQLAEVQADIEAAVARLQHLRTVTETVEVEIAYQGTAALAGGLDLRPLVSALRGVGDTLVESLATLIWVLAALLPWLPVLALFAWGANRLLRRWRSRRGVP